MGEFLPRKVKIVKREKDERLEALKEQKVNLYSISKCNTISNCQYEAWLNYIKGEKGARNVYGVAGEMIHNTLEDIMNGKAKKQDLLPTLQAELDELDMIGIDFPKDFRGGTAIRDNWIADMTHFCKHFKKPRGKFTTEELILFQIGENRWVHGYVDMIRHNKDNTLTILDWKTSSQFNKEDLLHHGRQLVLYGIGKEKEGFKVKEVAWIMLKYVEVKFMGLAKSNSKNETEIVKVVNRGKLIKELEKYLVYDLEKLGYDEIDIECLINDCRESNSFDGLPKEIAQKYSIKPYVMTYELTDELRQETLDYINAMADIFENKSEDEEDWEPVEIDKKNSFYCNTLCNFRKVCPHIKRYNDLQSMLNSEDADLF